MNCDNVFFLTLFLLQVLIKEEEVVPESIRNKAPSRNTLGTRAFKRHYRKLFLESHDQRLHVLRLL